MAAAFDRNTRELIRLWADKAPECGSTEKPRAFPDVNGVEVELSRNTVYNGAWKFRYAFVQETGFPVVMGGPIPHHKDTQQPNGKLSKPKSALFPSIQSAKANNKGAFAKAVEAEMNKAKAVVISQKDWDWFLPELKEPEPSTYAGDYIQAINEDKHNNLPCPIHFTSIGQCGCPGPSYVAPDDNL